ncbi:uncharacterized protein LOC103105854 [Monodelphis domestica]|uniref:uncharacterized protein LOC103105854 n=1 Tax=Monodelphis domestica TaxID=13616 RepID=UPI00044364E3|nr:uncharacterized protein LOC103105854 [Monodelphis domestica]
MRPRQRRVPSWASKYKGTEKKFPQLDRIKYFKHGSEVPYEVCVELEADIFADPPNTSRENVQNTEVQEFKFKVEMEKEMPLPRAEDFQRSDSRYPIHQEEEAGGEDYTLPNLVTKNFCDPQDFSEEKSSQSKKRLLLDSSGISGRTKRPCPQGSLGPTLCYHQKCCELVLLHEEVKELHTRIDAMTIAMNALQQYIQAMHQLLEIQVKRCSSSKENCNQSKATRDQPVLSFPFPAHSTPFKSTLCSTSSARPCQERAHRPCHNSAS